jgi:hypothetical protein
MIDEINLQRRRLFGAATATLAVAQLGMMSSAFAQAGAKPGAQAALARSARLTPVC